MSVGRIFMDAFESVIHAATHSKRLRAAFDTLGLHIGDFGKKVDGVDVFDGSGTPGRIA